MKRKNIEKIVLVNPPSPFLIDEKVFPNLGIINVGTILKERGMNVEIIDLAGEKKYLDKIKEIALSTNIIGFSSTTPQFYNTFQLNKVAKETNPNLFTILGGAHASAMAYLPLTDPNQEGLKSFDMIFAGEGEGFIIKEGVYKAPLVKNIENLPIPDRSLMDITSYEYYLNGKPTTTLMTQRGCPFSCNFCSGREIEMYKKFRMNSPEKIVKELDYLNKEFGYTSFMWYDDEININIKKLFKLSKLLEKRPYIHRGFVRSDLIHKNPDSVEALANAGFVELCSGVESGSDKILKQSGKRTSVEDNKFAARKIMDSGIRYKSFTMIGHPNETYEDIMKTKKWIQEVRPDGFDITILQPYPGSIIYNKSVPSSTFLGYKYEYNGLYFNKIDFSKNSAFFKGRAGEYESQSRTKTLTSEELIELRDEVEFELKEERKL